MDEVLAQSFIPQVVVAASEDCESIYDSHLFKGSAVHSATDAGPRVRLCTLPSLRRAQDSPRSDTEDIDVDKQTRQARQEYGNSYFPKLLESIVLATFDARRAQAFETFGHPVACILVVSSRNPNPISTLTQLYQQSYQDCPPFMSADFLRCVWFVNSPDSPPTQEDFAVVNSQFGPFCYEVPDSDFNQGVSAAITDAVYPYMHKVVKEWQEAHAAKSNAAFGFGKFLKKLVTNGPPRPETNLFFSVCRELQPHVASIPAPGKVHAVDLDMQMRRLADFAFILGEYKLAYAAYDTLRKPFLGEKQWAHYGSIHEMLALTATLSKQGDVNSLIDAAIYTYNSRCHLPIYALRCTLLVSGALVENGSELLAAGWLCTALLDVDPAFGSGSEPAETAMLMERTARAFERRGWQRKTDLWMLLADKEWQRSGLQVSPGASTTTPTDSTAPTAPAAPAAPAAEASSETAS